jgi:transcriptional regulator with XRE-family HTH domain
MAQQLRSTSLRRLRSGTSGLATGMTSRQVRHPLAVYPGRRAVTATATAGHRHRTPGQPADNPGVAPAPRAILTDVSIGGMLAQARHRAGLTVADVSARTRVREGLIRAIERDEFDACGGDFYARGHIRAIAAIVGADPGRLVGEYDAAHPSGRPVTLEELPTRPPRTPRRGRRGRWLAPAVFLLCLAAIGFAALRLTTGTGGSRLPAVAPSGHAAARAPGAAGGPRPAPRPAPTSSPARPRPAPPAVPVTQVTPVSAAAFGPSGTSDGDNPQDASLALSGDPATPWHTDWYTTARFGNLQAGTGLLLRLRRTVTAASVTIRLGRTPGADLQVRAGSTVSDMPVVASAAGAGGTVWLPLPSHPRIRYLVIWFTKLPPDAAGTYQADISAVTVSASRK